MAFKKGEIPNPHGGKLAKNKNTLLLKEMLAGDVPKALQVIRKCLDDPENMTWAAQQVLDRVFGKSAQSMEISGPNGGPIEYAPQININKK